MNQSIDYEDDDGIKRRVLVPSLDSPVNEGIPLSLDVDRLYPDTSIEFRRRLVQELWNVGLVEPRDFLKGPYVEKIRAAIIAAIRTDVIEITDFAKEKLGNG